MSSSHKKRGKRHPFPWSKYWKLSFLYFVVFLMIFALVDYYALMVFNFLWFLLLSVLLGLGFGYVHIRKHWHDNLDEIADDLL